MKLIARYIGRHLGLFVLALSFLTLEVMADLLQPALMARIVDDGVKQLDTAAILRCGGIMVAVACLGALGAVMRNLFASRTSQTIGMELRADLYRKVQSLPLANIDRLQPAAIITRITNDVTQIQEFINGSMRIMAKAPITCVGAILLLVLQTPWQLPILAVILLLVAGLVTANMKLGYPRFGRMQLALDRLNDRSREFLSAIRVVKAFGAEAQEANRFTAASDVLARSTTAAMQTMAIFGPLVNLTVNLGIVLLLWRSQTRSSAAIGELMASVNYMTQILFALGMVSNILNTAARALASSARVREILDEVPAQTPAQAPCTPRFAGEVALDDVSFAYAGAARSALQHVSFRAAPGQTIGIIGPTGAGKSTLVHLIPRFYDATAGTVSVDGVDVRAMEEQALRAAVAVVPQKALLFTGTIADNLRWGQAEATDEELRQAARTACADDFICRTANGYDTQLGQGGVNLSGGQKQRLCLARALVRRPRILILDDCTSALDAQTEATVLRGLRDQSADMTVLLISQRIAAVRHADRILCLEDGVVQGFGTHDELLARCPTYQAIYASQIGGNAHA